ncbi:MAG UNVERIFIED_CONTAM: hypothetical protein LVR18_42860 [Planctomycetaceae bacterium]
MAIHDSYSILVTGTIAVLGAAKELVLSAVDDVVLLGNISSTGTGSDLTVQSDSFVFIEGRLSVQDRLSVYGGTKRDGTNLDGSDARGSSIYLGSTGLLNTSSAGSKISLHGSRDVDILMPVIAGGQVGSGGVTWAGDGSAVTILAGQQIRLDAPVQAAAAITLKPGTPGSDDQGRNLVMSAASGLNAAGLGQDNTGSTIRIETTGDLEIAGNILSGGSIIQTFGASGQLLSENYAWSGRDSKIEVVAGGRVLVGSDTVDIHGNSLKKGAFLRISGGFDFGRRLTRTIPDSWCIREEE